MGSREHALPLATPDIALLTALCSRLETDSKADFVLLLSVKL